MSLWSAQRQASWQQGRSAPHWPRLRWVRRAPALSAPTRPSASVSTPPTSSRPPFGVSRTVTTSPVWTDDPGPVRPSQVRTRKNISDSRLRMKNRMMIRITGEMSMPPRLGRIERIGRSSGSVILIEEIADRRDELMAGIDHIERHQPGQHRARDQQPDIELQMTRIDQPENGAHRKSLRGRRTGSNLGAASPQDGAVRCSRPFSDLTCLALTCRGLRPKWPLSPISAHRQGCCRCVSGGGRSSVGRAPRSQ